MGNMALDRTETTSVEAILKGALARESRALSGVAPVISHMLDSPGQALVTDAIVARLRGMLNDLAQQLLYACQTSPPSEPSDPAVIDALAEDIARDTALLEHLYALAIEGHLTARLEQRASLDPVLSVLLQELIASDQPSIAELAMGTLAAQSRFMQSQRRMDLPLGELPSELFARVLAKFQSADLGLAAGEIESALASLRANYDEGAGRLGLLARLTSSMRGGAVAALELEHAGLALFTSSMAALTRQKRDFAVLACHENQAARLALSLRAGGMSAAGVERQFMLINPSQMLPEDLAALPTDRAQALLDGIAA